MRTSRFMEQQVVAALQQAEGGTPVTEVCRNFASASRPSITGSVNTPGSASPNCSEDRATVAVLATRVQEETGDHGTLAYVDQGYTGEETARDAEDHGITLEVVKLPDATHGFVLLLPRRWVVERDFAWASRFRRLARDYERLPETLAGLHLIAFVILMLQRLSALNSA